MCVLVIIIIVRHVEEIVSLISLNVYVIDPKYQKLLLKQMCLEKSWGVVQYLKLRM